MKFEMPNEFIKEIEWLITLKKIAIESMEFMQPKILQMIKDPVSLYLESQPSIEPNNYELFGSNYVGDITIYLGNLERFYRQSDEWYTPKIIVHIILIMCHELYHVEQCIYPEDYQCDREYHFKIESGVNCSAIEFIRTNMEKLSTIAEISVQDFNRYFNEIISGINEEVRNEKFVIESYSEDRLFVFYDQIFADYRLPDEVYDDYGDIRKSIDDIYVSYKKIYNNETIQRKICCIKENGKFIPPTNIIMEVISTALGRQSSGYPLNKSVVKIDYEQSIAMIVLVEDCNNERYKSHGFWIDTSWNPYVMGSRPTGFRTVFETWKFTEYQPVSSKIIIKD